MPRRTPTPTTTPRKRPVQARSRLTVHAILEATAQVLVARGYEKTTTGAVAERAGVSIGTLYQYFPNKEALVAGLTEMHMQEVLQMFNTALERHRHSPLPTLLRAVVRAGLDAHRLNPALHKVLVEQVPRQGRLAKSLALSEQLRAALESELRTRSHHLSGARARMIAFILEGAVETLTHRAVIERPAWLKTGELEEEIHTLLSSYIASASDDWSIAAPAPVQN